MNGDPDSGTDGDGLPVADAPDDAGPGIPRLALDRVRYADEVPWLPLWARRAVSGLVVGPWAAIGILSVELAAHDLAVPSMALWSAFIAAPFGRMLWKGRQWAHQRAAALALTRRRTRARAHAYKSMHSLAHVPDRTPVRVTGRVRARAVVGGLLRPEREGVLRRLDFVLPLFWLAESTSRRRFHLVHEAGVDFDLVDDTGAVVGVDVAGAYLLAPPAPAENVSPAIAAALRKLPVPSDVADLADRAIAGDVPCGERFVHVGDRVEICGVKDSEADPTGGHGGRFEGAAVRPVLRSARGAPLLIVPVGRLTEE